MKNADRVLAELRKLGEKSLYPQKIKFMVGMATCGNASGAGKVYRAIRQSINEEGLDAEVSGTGCLGFCQKEPLVYLQIPGKPRVIYSQFDEALAKELVQVTAKGEVFKRRALGMVVEDTDIVEDARRRLGEIPEGWKFPLINEIPFYAKQMKIATRNCGYIDPTSVEEYAARGGFSALAKVLGMDPEDVIATIKESGLRGRGGGGFPTGLKWELTRRSPGEQKYIICNADEGDPGAYMDRSILEGDPCSVLEGMAIGGYAIGANTGVIYVRAEYPLAIKILEIAIARVRKAGLLGKNILGSGFDFDIKIAKGAGAFVCGEETALIASIEGKPGEPRPRPPFPAEKGLWGCPTNINNVETWSNISPIICRGSKWYKQLGTETSAGTKVFALVGNIKNNGLVEVPMGITIREIVFDIGGGIEKNRELKGVQTGGPSGGCVPAGMLDLPIDYETLNKAGTIMGSGGMVVMHEHACMVDVARYFMDFAQKESCGKCLPCREGTKQMLGILESICNGTAAPGDIDTLEELAVAVRDASLCGLGQTVANPVLSTIKNFRQEYEAHVREKFCPAGNCVNLCAFTIDPEKCNGCGLCARECPEKAISGSPKEVHVLDQEKCLKCRICLLGCPAKAVKAVKREEVAGRVHSH